MTAGCSGVMSKGSVLGDIKCVIAVFLAAFDNRSGHAAGPAQLPGLFVPDAVIVKRGAGIVESMTVPRFIAPREALLNG
jgi:hypothetical protein